MNHFGKFVLVMLLTLFTTAAFSQSCSDCRYISTIFDSVTVETVHFGAGPRANGIVQQLYMDIYQPFDDTATNRAVAVFAFGGAFVTGSRDDWYVELVCHHLAQAGYVAVSIDYRIYDDIGEMIAEIFGAFPPQQMRIFFRPMQDMRAAVQYMKADFSELGNNYRIDTNRILIGGASSGAMTSLMTAYCDKDSEMAQMGGGSLAALNALGGFYSTTGFYPNYSWNALATFNVSGALINSDWVEPGDIPMIFAHGDADQVVPFKKGGFGGLTAGTFDMHGSYIVDSVARVKGVCSYLYTMEGHDHPSESMGIEYLKSVVYRLMLRMHAIINGRSFCCQLGLNVQPLDTLFIQTGGDSVSLTANMVNDNGNAQIRWCGIPCLVSAASTPVLVQPDTNLHYLTCIAYEGQCQAVSLNMVREGTVVVLPSSINEIAEGTFSISPNPVSGSFQIRLEESNFDSRLEIKIYNVTGKQVFHKVNPAANNSIWIDTTPFSPGTYFLKISSENFTWNPKKLVVVE